MGKGSHIHNWIVMENAGNPKSAPEQDGIIIHCPGCDDIVYLTPIEAQKFLDAKERGEQVDVTIMSTEN